MDRLVKFTSLINYRTEKMESRRFGHYKHLLKRNEKSQVQYFVRLLNIEDAQICITKRVGKEFKFNVFLILSDKETAYKAIEWALECKTEKETEDNYNAIKELSYRLFGTI